MANGLKRLKQAWITLPRRAKRVYLMSIGVIVVGGVIVTKMMSPDESALEGIAAKANLPGVSTSGSSGGETKVSYAQKRDIKTQEEQRLEQSRAENETYLPDMTKLSIAVEDDQPFFDSVPQEEPSDVLEDEPSSLEEQLEVEIAEDKAKQSNNAARMREEEFKAAVQAKLSMYSQITSNSKMTKAGGMLVSRASTAANQVDGSVATGAPNAMGGSSASIDSSTNGKRGFLPGDVLLAKLDNYVNTDESGSWLRLTLIDGPMEGARVMANYQRVGGVIVAKTSTISWKNRTSPFVGTLVTGDSKMQEGISSDTDYHTFYRWGMLIFSGALKGVGEVYLAGSDEVITDNGNIIKVNERGPKDIAFGVAKGVGDQLATIAAREFDIPPTVIADPQEIGLLGIMVTSEVNYEWLPLISEDDVY
ncbi:DotG/IcmE/VirB10 family protein [Shewanella colwelliana]|uniref:DotG/IcmE/VirB10 family protein n=1 Tax=Shewanella colwelliana TaxID=23 RepID=UPI0022AFD705|nr:DotG/IcmE/VirB10 family protein [Shewanella colwelliana]MCZ4337777.1 DotG/IcmE/VirB10 family protein [Shewanella colwelliana]